MCSGAHGVWVKVPIWGRTASSSGHPWGQVVGTTGTGREYARQYQACPPALLCPADGNTVPGLPRVTAHFSPCSERSRKNGLRTRARLPSPPPAGCPSRGATAAAVRAECPQSPPLLWKEDWSSELLGEKGLDLCPSKLFEPLGAPGGKARPRDPRQRGGGVGEWALLRPSLQPCCPEPSGLMASQAEVFSIPLTAKRSIPLRDHPPSLCLQPDAELQV